MARKRSSSSIEAAIRERRDEAARAAEAKHPDPQQLLVSYFGIRMIVDVKDVKGEWFRYEHTVDNDFIAAELADASTRRREVTHG